MGIFRKTKSLPEYVNIPVEPPSPKPKTKIVLKLKDGSRPVLYVTERIGMAWYDTFSRVDETDRFITFRLDDNTKVTYNANEIIGVSFTEVDADALTHDENFEI